MGKILDSGNAKYLQCPYCEKHECLPSKRIPKTVGRFRVKIIYDSILIFTCRKCGRVFRMEAGADIILWHNMTDKEKLNFKNIHYTKYKGGQKKK